MEPITKPEGIDRNRRGMSTAATEIAVTGANPLLSRLVTAATDDLVFETLKVRKECAVLFADIVARPMDLLGPPLVRDLVRNPEAQNRFEAAFKRGFQTRDAEIDLARMVGELA
jgi:hypothetical protein